MGSIGASRESGSTGSQLIDSFSERSTEWLKTFRDNLENGIKIVGTYSEQDAETLNALYTEIAKRENSSNGESESEDFVLRTPPDLDEAYLNYKSIRISKYMPKEEQARLRKLKAQYKAEMERLRKKYR